MCGIAGLLSKDSDQSKDTLSSIIERMTIPLNHRGPNDRRTWIDPHHALALGHTRLSILDLSSNGAQPMTSHCGRYVLSYNGEIYNTDSLKKTPPLDTHQFKGHSDTEITLEALAYWGVAKTLEHIQGMFALALWDKQARTLTLARDHLGKKPLYYGVIDDQLVFASELKSFQTTFKPLLNISRKALALYTQFGFVPAPHSIYENIYKLQPGHSLTINAANDKPLQDQASPDQSHTYWNARDIKKPLNNQNYQDRKQHLKTLLQDAVKSRLVADVPVSAFLSGGIDSSLIVSMMQEASDKPVKTFCVSFSDKAFDESKHAKNVAQHLGSDHSTLPVEEGEALEIIPQLPEIYDEPFADYSQIPTYLICKLMCNKTTVALSGDGGDEAFCGYSRYFMADKLLNKTKHIPPAIKILLQKTLLSCSQQSLDSFIGALSKLPLFKNSNGLSGKRLHSIAKFIGANTAQDMAISIMSLYPNVQSLTSTEPTNLMLPNMEGLGALETMMMIDTQYYLPDDVLVKVDRASMANSLEIRSPLLDKNIVEFAWNLPLSDKIFPGKMRGKKILYDILQDYIPEELINRPKQGFSVPMASWLRGPLREWAGDLLSNSMLEKTGLYNKAHVQNLWNDFQTGKRDHHHIIWTILMAQSWHNQWARS